MMRIILFVLTLLSASMATAQEAAAPSLEQRIDALIAKEIADGAPSAAMVAVVDGKSVLVKGYGTARLDSGQKANARTLFKIGSISKTFAWLSVLKLASEGRVDLDADLNFYLPEKLRFPKSNFGTITLRHIMQHRGGFEDNAALFLRRDDDASRADWVLAQRPARVAPAGQQVSYSNWASNLVGEVIATVTGMPYERYVQHNILEPAGMRSTILSSPGRNGSGGEALEGRMAMPVERRSGGAKQVALRTVGPMNVSGSVALDAEDAARYLALLLAMAKGEERLGIDPKYWREIMAPVREDRFKLGFERGRLLELPTVGHRGLTRFSSDMALVPSRDYGIFVSFNARPDDGRPYEFVRDISKLVLSAGGLPSAPKAIPDPRPEELAGLYASTRRSVTTIEKFGSMAQEARVIANADGTIKFGKGNWAAIGEDIWRNVDTGQRLLVVRDGAGNVVALSGVSALYERKDAWQSQIAFFVAIGAVTVFSLIVLAVAAWQRIRRKQLAGGRWGIVPVATAVTWLALVGAFVWTQRTALSFDDAKQAGYPALPVKVAVGLAYASLAAFLFQIAATIRFVTNADGGRVWRATQLLFVIVSAMMVLQLAEWNVLFHSFYRGL